MEEKFGSMIDCGSVLERESGDECGIKAQQSGGVIFCSGEPGLEKMKCFKIAFVPRSEHRDLWSSKVSTMP